MRGNIPLTNFIKLESFEPQWRLLISGVINELKITGLIEREPDIQVRIQIVISQIIAPENKTADSSCILTSNFSEAMTVGLKRSVEFLSDFLDRKSWFFFGLINGDSEAPIFIVYYETINLAVYTQKLQTEEKNKFFPSLN